MSTEVVQAGQVWKSESKGIAWRAITYAAKKWLCEVVEKGSQDRWKVGDQHWWSEAEIREDLRPAPAAEAKGDEVESGSYVNISTRAEWEVRALGGRIWGRVASLWLGGWVELRSDDFRGPSAFFARLPRAYASKVMQGITARYAERAEAPASRYVPVGPPLGCDPRCKPALPCRRDGCASATRWDENERAAVKYRRINDEHYAETRLAADKSVAEALRRATVLPADPSLSGRAALARQSWVAGSLLDRPSLRGRR